MYYTFQPVPAIDTVNNHFGLFFFCAFLALALLVAMLNSIDDRAWVPFAPTLVIVLVLAAMAAGVSYNTGSIITYANTPVTGTLVGFQGEGFRHREGKVTSEYHYTYVIYQVPEGQVMMRACGGCVYPQQAILYRN